MGVDAYAILEAKGEALKIPVRKIEEGEVSGSVLSYIMEDTSARYKVIPLGISQGVLEVGMVDPENVEAVDALNFISSKSGIPFKIFLITEEDFESVFEMYKGLVGKVTSELGAIKESELPGSNLVDLTDVLNLEATAAKGKTVTTIIEDAPIKQALNTVLRYAIEGNASDIHIEPMAETLRIRFRVDGVLHTTLKLPKKFADPLVAMIKVLTQTMKLDEKRKPQDGRFSANLENRKIDFRVSTFPTYYGEKIEMWILDQIKGIFKLNNLGI